jgi:hypothetical protein
MGTGKALTQNNAWAMASRQKTRKNDSGGQSLLRKISPMVAFFCGELAAGAD